MAETSHHGEMILEHPIIAHMRSLDSIERRIVDGVAPLAKQMFEESAGRLAEKINDEVASDAVFQAQALAVGDLSQATDDLLWLKNQQTVAPEVADDRIGKIWLLAAVVDRFMTDTVVVEPVAAEPAASEELTDEALRAKEFFYDRSLEEVAEDLMGMRLRVGNGDTVIISGVQKQDGEYNAKFQDDPMFGVDRRGAHVGTTQGHYLLYLAAGAPDECIRITGITLADGSKIKSGGATAKELGLHGVVQSGDVRIVGQDDNTTIRLVRFSAAAK